MNTLYLQGHCPCCDEKFKLPMDKLDIVQYGDNKYVDCPTEWCRTGIHFECLTFGYDDIYDYKDDDYDDNYDDEI